MSYVAPHTHMTHTLYLHDALPICCGAHRPRELAMIDAAHDARHDQHPRARLAADEAHLALAVDGDDGVRDGAQPVDRDRERSEEHTSELQSPDQLVCRLLLEKKT